MSLREGRFLSFRYVILDSGDVEVEVEVEVERCRCSVRTAFVLSRGLGDDFGLEFRL